LSACPHDAEASQRSVVAKRLKLGRLSPVFLAAYRADEIDLEEAQAFALRRCSSFPIQACRRRVASSNASSEH
jgi:hypothetical protein